MASAMLLAAVALGAVQAESSAASPRIGFLSPGTSESTAPVLSALRQGLREHGYVEGTNVAIEPRFANGQFDRLPELARELTGLPVDVLVTFVTEASLAARSSSKTVPIVMVGVGDPAPIERAFAAIAKERISAVNVLPDPTLVGEHGARIAEFE